MVFDPSNWPIDCLSRCGSNEYVQDTGNPNWKSIKARLENLEAGSYKPLSQADTVLWVDKDTGSDNNPGTEAAPFENLRKALDILQSFTWVHNCVVRWRGYHTLPYDYATVIRVENNKSILLDGSDEVDIIAAAVVSDISGQINGNWREIGNSGLALTPNYAKGKKIKLGNIGGNPGALTGQMSTIIGNTADTYRVAWPFTNDPVGYEFEVVMSSSTLEVNDGGFCGQPDFFDKQIYGGIWNVYGFGAVQLQRCTFKGNSPVTVIHRDKSRFHFASCCFDKPQLPYFNNLWRLTFIFCNGTAHGCTMNVKDPTDITGATLLPLDKCGFGSIGGDGSQIDAFYDIYNEWSKGFFDFYGSFAYKITEEACSGHAPRVRNYSHVDFFEQFNSCMDILVTHYNCSFGGYIPYDFPPPPSIFPGIRDVDGCVCLGSSVDISNSYHGIYSRRGKIRLEGSNITGINNIVFGVCLIDTASLYYESGSQANVTLTGAGGDVSLDNLVAIPGGHAGVLGGVPVRDVLTGCVARIQPELGV